LRGGNKLAPPSVDAAEVLFERRNHRRAGDLPASAEVGEVQLVEDGRCHGRQLLAPEGADLSGDRRGGIHAREPVRSRRALRDRTTVL
jgi:hypothetical protein